MIEVEKWGLKRNGGNYCICRGKDEMFCFSAVIQLGEIKNILSKFITWKNKRAYN